MGSLGDGNLRAGGQVADMYVDLQIAAGFCSLLHQVGNPFIRGDAQDSDWAHGRGPPFYKLF